MQAAQSDPLFILLNCECLSSVAALENIFGLEFVVGLFSFFIPTST